MPAYVVVHATIKDPEKMKAYGAAAGPEFFSLREYRVGDDARFVHAKRSAQRCAASTTAG